MKKLLKEKCILSFFPIIFGVIFSFGYNSGYNSFFYQEKAKFLEFFYKGFLKTRFLINDLFLFFHDDIVYKLYKRITLPYFLQYQSFSPKEYCFYFSIFLFCTILGVVFAHLCYKILLKEPYCIIKEKAVLISIAFQTFYWLAFYFATPYDGFFFVLLACFILVVNNRNIKESHKNYMLFFIVLLASFVKETAFLMPVYYFYHNKLFDKNTIFSLVLFLLFLLVFSCLLVGLDIDLFENDIVFGLKDLIIVILFSHIIFFTFKILKKVDVCFLLFSFIYLIVVFISSIEFELSSLLQILFAYILICLLDKKKSLYV